MCEQSVKVIVYPSFVNKTYEYTQTRRVVTTDPTSPYYCTLYNNLKFKVRMLLIIIMQ